MTSSKKKTKKRRKPELKEILPAMSSAQKMFKMMRNLGLNTPFGFRDQHLSQLRLFAERHAKV